jgi:Tfp pilus assembly protein PilF
LVLAGAAQEPPAVLVENAQQAIERGEADRALQLLDTALAGDRANATALNLRCRVLYSEQQAEYQAAYRDQARDWGKDQGKDEIKDQGKDQIKDRIKDQIKDQIKQAVPLCAKAAELQPRSSEMQLWLGRAYGVQAQHAPVWKAMGLASHVRNSLEAAYRLDPHNLEAASDLGDFYVQAPHALGGGEDRLDQLAQQVATVAPAEAHLLRARLAEHQHDDAKAEAELHAAVASASRTEAGQSWLELARLYGRQAKDGEMVQALQHAVEAGPAGGPVLVEAGRLLIRKGQQPALAEGWLREYLNGPALTEEEPAFEVHVELARLLASESRDAEAEEQMRRAHELASAIPLKLPHGPAENTALIEGDGKDVRH